jgi:hypothetical protein
MYRTVKTDISYHIYLKEKKQIALTVLLYECIYPSKRGKINKGVLYGREENNTNQFFLY